MNRFIDSRDRSYSHITRTVLAVVAALALLAGVVGTGPGRASRVLADDATPAALAEPAAADEGPAPPEEPVIDDEPAPEPSDVLTEETETPEALPVEAETPEPEDEGADADPTTAEPAATPSPETAPTVEAPPTPDLSYTPAERPDCVPAAGQAEIVAHGAFLDYDCAYEGQLTGGNIAPAAVQLDWTVTAAVDGGWAVQLRPPVVDPTAPPPWTAAESGAAELTHRSGIGGAAGETLDTFDETAALAFGLRVHRVACSVDTQTVTLNAAVVASLPGHAEAAVAATAPQPEPFTLTPALAPIPEPTLSFGGALDFGSVPVDAMGVQEAPAPQTITVTIEGLDRACGAWALGLSSTALGGEDGSTMAASTLILTSIDDEALAGGECPLDGGCAIATVAAGPDAAAAVTYTLGVSLVLPVQPRATTFNATLSATLAAVES